MAGRIGLRKLLVTFTIAAFALSSSGCLWGFVRDAETGNPLSGVNVTYTDSVGGSASTITDENGMYAFDQATGPYPASGAVTFQLARPGYDPLTVPRLVDYNDNPNASLANLSSFTEGQSFELMPHMVQRVNLEITGLDIDHAALAPPTMLKQVYMGAYQVLDPDNPGVVCQAASPGVNYVSANPVAVPLSIPCTVMGDNFSMAIAVFIHHEWADPAPHSATYVSFAGFDWTAPAQETEWAYETLDSDDYVGPDDPHISFQARIRFRSALGPE